MEKCTTLKDNASRTYFKALEADQNGIGKNCRRKNGDWKTTLVIRRADNAQR